MRFSNEKLDPEYAILPAPRAETTAPTTCDQGHVHFPTTYGYEEAEVQLMRRTDLETWVIVGILPHAEAKLIVECASDFRAEKAELRRAREAERRLRFMGHARGPVGREKVGRFVADEDARDDRGTWHEVWT